MHSKCCAAKPLTVSVSTPRGLAGSRNKLRCLLSSRYSGRPVSLRKYSASVAQKTTEYIPTRIDVLKERSRKERRVVFTPDQWKRHRAVDRYNRHLSTLFDSSIFDLIAPVLFVTGLAAGVNAINQFTDYSVGLPMSALGLTTGSLSLLLVFRTNSAYDRWWEARKIWGGLLNRSRDFVRQGLTWFSVEDKALREQLVRYTIAFAFSLKVFPRSSPLASSEDSLRFPRSSPLA
ncbi:hypothetical protein CYMTET_36779, partial [Cymbomonas tetramitiformis]